MPKASVKRLIECKKDQLIDLVLDIEKYPEFVPFCLGSQVYEKNKEGNLTLIIADLTIGKGPFKDTYKSDVKFDKENSTINVTNIGGPLNHLENNWKFIETEGGTEISFDIDFEIENKFLNILMSKSFEFGLNRIADAFQKRAEDLYRPIEND
ncbi:type II toxin-antitoxin system RatA family toxin [Candidatus Pelagibacter sp.]|nr:type II toxin-antitoxin system RatA family toxin [Candidatus Pelagibacter sp.]